MSWQIAIDGPASAGKSTIAKMIAERLNFEHIDTGAMYRAVTLKAINLKINMYDEKEFVFLENTKIDFINQELYLDGLNVNEEIRSLAVSNNASLVASYGSVRTKLVSLQRNLASNKNVVMDGRDIGTVVLKDANLKIFLTADLHERAKRRMLERIAAGQVEQSLENTIKEIEERDYKDSNRLINPLAKADDAIEIDSSTIDANAVVEKIIKLVLERGYKMEKQKTKNSPSVEEKLNSSIDILGLTPLFKYALEQANITKVSELACKTKEELLSIKGIGEKRYADLTKKLEELGLSFDELKAEKSKEVKEDKKAKPKKEPVEEVKVEPVVEEEPVVEAAEEDEEDYDEDAEVEVEEDEEEESTEEAKTKYRTLQVVEGTVVEVVAPREAFKRGNKEYKAKPERVLIQLEDGQQGFLFRRDTADIQENEELFDLFFEGDKVKVVIKRIFPNGGKFIFSTLLLKMRDDLNKFNQYIENPGVIKAKVVKKINTGYLLNHEEFSCLLPDSQVMKSETEESLIGNEIEVSPIRIDYGRIRLIVSQTVAYSLSIRKDRLAFLETVNVGDEFEGTVKNIESYGAFVEIGPGVEGLLHISELDHQRVYKVDKVLKTGELVKVKVIKMDGEHVGLSRKALIPNVWKEFTTDNSEGSVVEVKALEINNSGVVVELADGVVGFLPRSEFSHNREANLNDEVKVDDTFEVKIIEVDNNKRRLIVSKKQLEENPWNKYSLRQGETIEVSVVKELKDGFIFQYQEISGYLPKANVQQGKELKVDDTIKVRVRLFDAESSRFIVQYRTESDRTQQRQVYGKVQKTQQEKLTSSFGDIFEQFSKKK